MVRAKVSDCDDGTLFCAGLIGFVLSAVLIGLICLVVSTTKHESQQEVRIRELEQAMKDQRPELSPEYRVRPKTIEQIREELESKERTVRSEE